MGATHNIPLIRTVLSHLSQTISVCPQVIRWDLGFGKLFVFGVEVVVAVERAWPPFVLTWGNSSGINSNYILQLGHLMLRLSKMARKLKFSITLLLGYGH